MAQNIDIDKLAEEAFPPITITLNGKQYTLGVVTEDDMREFANTGNDQTRASSLLARLLGVGDTTFVRVDFRKVQLALQKLVTAFTEQVQGAAEGKEQAGETV